MKVQADKGESKNKAVADDFSKQLGSTVSGSYFADTRPEAITQRKLKQMANNTLQAKKEAQLQSMANNYAQGTVGKKRSGDLGSVAQLIKYKEVEYSRELGNIGAFHAEANKDLDDIDKARDVNRDKKMLNVIGNSDYEVNSPQELAGIILPVGKGYQLTLDNEFKVLSPKITRIIELARGVREMTPVMKRDDSTESHEYVIMNMVEVREKTTEVKERVQWRKVDSIDPLAEQVMDKARFSMMVILEYVDPDQEPSKQQIRKQAKQQQQIVKDEKIIIQNTETIEQTASEIEPQLRMSGDEQYLRGTIGAKADESGGKHLTIGKKTATKPLLEKDPEEAKGILWASVWSQGVNEAFVEGGTDADHEFRLISPIPQELEPSLKTGNIEAFISEARQGTIENNGENPWRAYYHLGNDDLTTLGKEIVKLFENGYVME